MKGGEAGGGWPRRLPGCTREGTYMLVFHMCVQSAGPQAASPTRPAHVPQDHNYWEYFGDGFTWSSFLLARGVFTSNFRVVYASVCLLKLGTERPRRKKQESPCMCLSEG